MGPPADVCIFGAGCGRSCSCGCGCMCLAALMLTLALQNTYRVGRASAPSNERMYYRAPTTPIVYDTGEVGCGATKVSCSAGGMWPVKTRIRGWLLSEVDEY